MNTKTKVWFICRYCGEEWTLYGMEVKKCLCPNCDIENDYDCVTEVPFDNDNQVMFLVRFVSSNGENLYRILSDRQNLINHVFFEKEMMDEKTASERVMDMLKNGITIDPILIDPRLEVEKVEGWKIVESLENGENQ